MARCAIVSFRLGHTDGVSVVAATWQRALTEIGFTVRTVAGAGAVDVLVPGLGIDDDIEPDRDALRAALADVDLVVVEKEHTCRHGVHCGASRAERRRRRSHDPALLG